MREYRFDPLGELPVIRAVMKGAEGERRATFVLDTGCSLTQVHSRLLKLIGCGEDKRIKNVSIGGVTGKGESAYIVALDYLGLFGTRFKSFEIAGVDFSKWAEAGIDGLIGWDLIRTFNLEMSGPKGILKVF